MIIIKGFFILMAVIFFFSSVSTDASPVTITINNPTCYNVYFDEKQLIEKYSNGTVTLYIEGGMLSREFDIWYELPLSSNVPLYIKGDHRTFRENQTTFTINEPQITENYGTFILIKNRAGNAITFWTGGTVNPLLEQRGTPSQHNILRASDKREFSPGETAVFDIGRDTRHDDYFIRDSRVDVPFEVPSPLNRNYLYVFEYSANSITQTDSRPLTEAGLPAPITVEFDLNNIELNQDDKNRLIQALTTALEHHKVPLRPVENENSYEGRIFYSMRISINTRITQPTNQNDFSLTLLRNGTEIRSSIAIRNPITGNPDTRQERFLNNFIRNNRLNDISTFFESIINDL